MTQNRRIAFNTFATYGRSMVGVLCGIFTARWVLEALGQIDYGLYAVIAGMAIFIGFLNIQFSSAISRYYAFSIGQAKGDANKDHGLSECRAWFTTAVLIHTVVPFVLVMIGWPIGVYALKYGWIQVPTERLDACLWVWRIVCLSTFFCMISVPFQAMYIAKQYIAELTIYSLAQTIARTLFVYYMVVMPRAWLVPYAAVMAAITIIPQIIICIRAIMVFRECKILPRVFFEFSRIKKISGYAVWTALGGIGYVASHQCMSIVMNNYFGAKVAGSFGVSQTVSGEASSLTGALQNAFQPAIATKYGEGNVESMRRMAFRVCKLGTVLTLVFALPMALEIDEVLLLWLKTPPPFAAELSLCALAFITLEKMTSGHVIAVNASGIIAKFQVVRGLIRTAVIPLAMIPAYFGWGPVAAAMALPISVLLVDVGDVYLSRGVVGMSARLWVKDVVCPIAALVLIEYGIGYLPRFVMPASFLRVCMTASLVILTIIPFSWIAILSQSERDRLRNFVRARITRNQQ